MSNYEIADRFSLLSRLMDLHGTDAFRAKSNSIAAYHIERLPQEAAELDDATLAAQPGIGASLCKKIREVQQTGTLDALEKLLADTPAGVLDILRIKGLGPKKVSLIWKELGIESVGELEYACQENRLASIKGFGVKTQQSVLDAIRFLRTHEGMWLWAQLEPAAAHWLELLRRLFPDGRHAVTGAFRRQLEILDGIDLLTTTPLDRLPPLLEEGECVSGDGLLTVRIEGQPLVRVHTATEENFYARLFETTGSEEFLSAFRNQYTVPATPVSEETMFESNGLSFIAPAMRETEAALRRAALGPLPEPVQPHHIRGIIHSHSRWSDGEHTIREMAEAARGQGLEYLVISDHSQAAYYANGLSPERVRAQHEEIDALNRKLAPFRIFKSIEADILNDGALDYDPQTLGSFDLVIASVHSNLKMGAEKANARLLRAIENPYTTILGHLTGRLLLSRAGYEIDHRLLIDACAAHGVAIEINAHPRRLDMDWRWIGYALERGVLFSINPDAHSVSGFGDTRYGVLVAQKGGLTEASNLSSFTLEQMGAYLAKYREKAGAAVPG